MPMHLEIQSHTSEVEVLEKMTVHGLNLTTNETSTEVYLVQYKNGNRDRMFIHDGKAYSIGQMGDVLSGLICFDSFKWID